MKLPFHYILDGHTPVLTEDPLQWAEYFENTDRQVARTEMENCTVSTVFVGLDMAFGRGVPRLFETMVFGGPMDREQRSYATWEEAEAGHEACLAALRVCSKMKSL